MNKKSSGLVCVVDDDEMVRESIIMLAAALGHKVCCHADCRSFLDDPQRHDCDCLLLDVRLPGISGPELQERLLTELPVPPIVFISGHSTVPLAVKAMQLGALDFLQKPFDETILIARIDQAVAQSRRLRNERAKKSAMAGRLDQLSQREREVMTAMVAGLPTKQIADQFGISVRTVEQHRANLKRKLGVRSLAEVLQASNVLMENTGRSSPEQ